MNNFRLSRPMRVFLLAITLIAGCSKPQPQPQPAAPRQDFLISDMDTSVNPGDDFFQYANGGWLKKNPIPATESAWGIGNLVRDDLYVRLRTINENSAKANAAPGTDEQKIGDFWTTAMDEAKAEQLKLTPLKPELDRIDAIASTQDAINEAFALQRLGIDAFFGFYVGQDERQSDVMSVHLLQGGLGLPDRDYYFNPKDTVAKVRTEYVAHLENMLKLMGTDEPTAKANAAKIMEFETALAKVSRKLEDLRDPVRNYNKMTAGDVTKKHTPSIVWDDRLAAWNLHTSYVVVGQPEFFTGVEALLKKTPVPVLKDYLRYHLVTEFASFLSKDVDAEDFNFYHRVLSGQKEPRPRWKRVLDSEQGPMGMVVGRIFVKAYFPESEKKRYTGLVEAIRTAYSERIDRLDWMSPETKAKAHQKLAAVTKKVGYPDKWKDYSGLMIGRSSYADNMMSISRWQFDDMLSKFGKPVDRTEWTMTPQTYNAYYNPSNNEIVLPAAQFEIPGVKDSDLDDAVVYGYTGGSTIGHEITHGFDDEGRQYDAAGNLADWWSKEDAKKFQDRAAVMVKQFNAYEPLPGLHINGKASLGENIADYGGILLGLDAFKKTDQYRKGEKIGGLTPVQRYFLGYALGWMEQRRDELTQRNLLSDVHSPAKWRVIGPLSNIPDFYEAFGIKQGQPMWLPIEAHVQIW